MCIHPLHLAEIWLFGHDEEPERALFVYTPLGIVKHKAGEAGTKVIVFTKDTHRTTRLPLQTGMRTAAAAHAAPPRPRRPVGERRSVTHYG